MTPASRKKPSGPKRDSAGKKKGSSRAKPRRSPELRGPAEAPEPGASREEVSARAEELEALYRPLREAGEAELSKTKSGRALLEKNRTHGEELGELYESIAGGKTPLEAGHRLARQRREEFIEKHRQRFLDAYTPHARLQPSVEAVAQILRPEMSPQTGWVAETGSAGSTLLQPKPVLGGEQAYSTQVLVPAATVVPDDLGTVSRGLDEPMPPQPVRECLGQPFPLQQRRSEAAPVGFASTVASPSGIVMADGWCCGSFFIPVQVTTANAWVAQDFQVPAGIVHYNAAVDYDYSFSGVTAVGVGLAVISLNVAVVIDSGDGSPAKREAFSIHLLTVPAFGNERIIHSGKGETAKMWFGRGGSSTQKEPSNGTVRVWVGADGHCVGIGVWSWATFESTVTVKNICISSEV